MVQKGICDLKIIKILKYNATTDHEEEESPGNFAEDVYLFSKHKGQSFSSD